MLYITVDDQSDHHSILNARRILKKSEWKEDEVIISIIALCGRFGNCPHDLPVTYSAYHCLIRELNACHQKLTLEQTVALIYSLATDTPVPITVFDKFVVIDSKESGFVINQVIDTNPNIKNTICSENQKFILKSGLLTSVLSALCEVDDLETALSLSMKDYTSKYDLTDARFQVVKLLSRLLSISWNDPLPLSESLCKIAVWTSFVIESYISQHCDNWSSNVLKLCSEVHVNSVSLLSNTLATSETDLVHKLLEKYYSWVLHFPCRSFILDILEMVVGVLLKVSSENSEEMMKLPCLPWLCVVRLLEHSIDISSESTTTELSADVCPQIVTLASPEDDTLSDHADVSWLDDLITTVPADMDRKAADEDYRSTRQQRIRDNIARLFTVMPRYQVECSDVILHAFKLILETNYFQSSESVFGKYITCMCISEALSSDIQREIFEQALSIESENSEEMLAFMLVHTSSDSKTVHAELVMNHFVDKILKGIKTEKFPCQIVWLARCFLSKDSLKTFVKRLIFSFVQLSNSNDHNTEVMAQTVYVLNMMVYNGNYLSSEERREVLPTCILKYEDLDYPMEELSEFVQAFASFSLYQPNFSFPPYLMPLFTSLELDEEKDINVIIFMYRTFAYYKCMEGTKFRKMFYENIPSMPEKIEKYYTSANMTLLLTNILERYTHGLNVTTSSAVHLAIMDCVLLAIAWEFPLNAAFMAQLRTTLHAIDVFELRCACEEWGSLDGLERTNSVFRIYRNPLLNDTVSFHMLVREAVEARVLDIIKDEKLSTLFPAYSPKDFKISADIFDFEREGSCSPSNVFRIIRSELCSYIFKYKNIRSAVQPFDEVEKFAVDVSSVAFYSVEDAKCATNLLGENFKLNHVYIMNHILAAMTNTRTVQNIEVYPLNLLFGQTFYICLTSERYSKVEWTDDILSLFETWLDQCADDHYPTVVFSPVFASSLAKIMVNKSSSLTLIAKLRKMIGKRMNLLHKWIAKSTCSAAVFSELGNMFEDIIANEDCDQEEFKQAIYDCIPHLITPTVVDDLCQSYQLRIQKTERFFKSFVNFRGIRPSSSKGMKSLIDRLEENNMIFYEVLKLICRYGDSDSHKKLMSTACSIVSQWIGITEQQKILLLTEIQGEVGGHEMVNQETTLVFRLMAGTYLLGYCQELANHVIQYSMTDYFSDSDSVKECGKRSARSLSPSPRSTDSTSASNSARNQNLCTYLSSEQQFVSQHWYNCYTCGMVESVGVCSVCAVNCHRGHDLVYSKHGSFFCDCGARQCSSLVEVKHVMSAINAARGKVFNQEQFSDYSQVEEIRLFEIPDDIDITLDEVVSNLKVLADKLNSQWKNVEHLIHCVQQCRLNMWNLKTNRLAVIKSYEAKEIPVVYDANIMDPESLGTKHHLNVSTLKRQPEMPPELRIRGKSTSGLVTLEGGLQLWLVAEGSSLYIHHIHPCLEVADEWSHPVNFNFLRIDVESLPFSAFRINCSEDKAAIISRNEILLIRFGREGDIVNKTSIVIPDTEGSPNPLVKALFVAGSPAIVAIATLQFIRLYDITLDVGNFLEELVVPVGNVDDIQLIWHDNKLFLFVLNSSGHLYLHRVTNTDPKNSSYFLTNIIETPVDREAGNNVSIYYSQHSQLFFFSQEHATWFGHVNLSALSNDTVTIVWTKLKVEEGLHCWQESSGVIGAISSKHTTLLVYMYPSTTEHLLVQKCTLEDQIYNHILFTGPTKEKVYGLSTFYDSSLIFCYTSSWIALRDWWIGDDLPIEFRPLKSVSLNSLDNDVVSEDLVTMMEICEPISRSDVQCAQIARFYDPVDMDNRLKTAGSLALTVLQTENLEFVFRVNDPSIIVRAIRIEVPADKGPIEAKFNNHTISLTTHVGRFFDILLTREESVAIDPRNICLSVTAAAEQRTVVITSIRLFGISRRDFGYAQVQVTGRNPLTLPERSLLQTTEILTTLRKAIPESMDNDRLPELAKKLGSYRSSHSDVVSAAFKLMRELNSNNMKDYYTMKDSITLNDLKTWMENKELIPVPLVPHVLRQIKFMAYSRVDILLKFIRTELSATRVMLYILQHLQRGDTDVMLTLEVFCGLFFMFLSTEPRETKFITELYLSVFSDEKTSHLAHKLRMVSQTFIYSYSMCSRTDRTLARTLGSPYPVLRWGGLRPFFQRSKIVKPESDIATLAFLMGEMTTTEELNSTDMFDLESKFMLDFLEAIFKKIHDEGNGSMFPLGPFISRYDAVPATSLLILAIVLLAQLYPMRFYPIVNSLIDMIQWKNISIDSHSDYFSQFLLVRLLSVTLLKCNEHIDNRKKSDEKEDGGFNSDIVSLTGSVYPSSIVFNNPADITYNCLDDKTKRTSKMGVEQLLEQVVEKIVEAGGLTCCFNVLTAALPIWRKYRPDNGYQKLWPREVQPNNPDSSSGTCSNKPMSSDEYSYSMVTDVCLRLPYQMKKLLKKMEFGEEWKPLLCEYVSFNQAPMVRRHSKKLLMFICNGDKQMYRSIRDKHTLSFQMQSLRRKIERCEGNISHQRMTEIVEILNSIKTAATEKPALWCVICEQELTWLLQVACHISDPVASHVVELIVMAIRDFSPQQASSEEYNHLADRLIAVEKNLALLKMLLVRYLIGREEAGRWILHGMTRSTIQLSSRQNQLVLFRILLSELWPIGRSLGSHGAQLADIISSYIARLLPTTELKSLVESELKALEDIAERIKSVGHEKTYQTTTELGLGWKFMLMVTNPCLNCFSRKESMDTFKLNAVKLDARFSSNAMMVKLVRHYEISKVIIKLTDVKRSKMAKKVVLYYCPNVVESPVELKTNTKLWQKAGSASISNGDGETTVSLAIPITTSSLIIQFPEISESRQDNEYHCPRCSASVSASPGVCENCGENVFQCIKCRAISYDDRDPFLCQSCGYCKYARLDISVVCRPLPGVQSINSDAERSNAVDSMSRLLVEMEKSRTKLHLGRTLCESLWINNRPLAPIQVHMENPEISESIVSSLPPVSPQQHSIFGILQALNYCKAAHEELCTQTQQVIAFREELRNYDQVTSEAPKLLHQSVNQGFYNTSTQCFGCLCASILHSISIIQGICDDPTCASQLLNDQPAYFQFVQLGQKYDPLRTATDEFVCRMAFDSSLGTQRLCELVTEGIVRPSVLARSILNFNDSMWQVKLKSFISCAIKNPSEELTLSFLNLMSKLIHEGRKIRKRVFRKYHHKSSKDSDDEEKAPISRKVKVNNEGLLKNKQCGSWLNGDKLWENILSTSAADIDGESLKGFDNWFWMALFSSRITIRSSAAQLFLLISKQPGHMGVAVCMLLRGLKCTKAVPPHMTDQFFYAAHSIVQRSGQVKARLFSSCLHLMLMDEIYKECKQMHEDEEKETTLDHDFGTVLRNYVDLLSALLYGNSLEFSFLKAAKDHILIPLLQSTIFLKRVVLRRTRAVDSARVTMERLLRSLSSKEPLILLKAAAHSLQENLDNYTLTQIASVILDILDPEKQKEEEFFIQIEKDPAQEDFLQGRMTGNPYKSTDPGMGPLMRDIKNRICRDTEMIALLEDDNGMELLVNNQIISLSLPVATVYEKLCRKNRPGQPLTIVYRMRGLLGDAVEPFVTSLTEGTAGENNENDAISSIVDAFTSYGGVERSLFLISNADLSTGGRLLLTCMKRLMECCAKSELGRLNLVKSGAVSTFINVTRKCVDLHASDDGVLSIAADYMDLVGHLVSDISTHPHIQNIGIEAAEWLIQLALQQKLKSLGIMAVDWKPIHLKLMANCSSMLGNVVLGDSSTEKVLVDCCMEHLTWKQIDSNSNVAERLEQISFAEILAKIVEGILPSEAGNKLKTNILESGVVSEACEYLLASHPPLYSTTETAEWKSFLTKPSLKLMLSFMNSMAKNHESTQLAISEKSLHALHRLEQVASDNSIGTLAENVVEALKSNQEVAAKIETVRLETKQKKRQMAMAMRKKQLSKMGMQMDKQGAVKVSDRKIANEPVLDEVCDPLSSCCICREPILSGQKVAAAYAFASVSNAAHVPLLSSVSQMVLVHIDCHQGAIHRSGSSRSNDEWTRASLHNAGARCNILTPIALTNSVAPAKWTAALARYQSDLDIIASTPEVSRSIVFVDICLLIDRFISFGSFSEKSHGGGRESNAQYLAVLHLLACTLPVTDLPTHISRWRIYTFLMTELSLASWNEQRVDVLRVTLDVALTEGTERSWERLRETCLSWAFVDGYFRKVVTIDGGDRTDWLRSHVLETFKQTLPFVLWFDTSVAPSVDFNSFAEIMDLPVAELESFFIPEEDIESDPLSDSEA